MHLHSFHLCRRVGRGKQREQDTRQNQNQFLFHHAVSMVKAECPKSSTSKLRYEHGRGLERQTQNRRHQIVRVDRLRQVGLKAGQ